MSEFRKCHAGPNLQLVYLARDFQQCLIAIAFKEDSRNPIAGFCGLTCLQRQSPINHICFNQLFYDVHLLFQHLLWPLIKKTHLLVKLNANRRASALSLLLFNACTNSQFVLTNVQLTHKFMLAQCAVIGCGSPPRQRTSVKSVWKLDTSPGG